MAAVQTMPQKWFVVMWVIIGLLAGVLMLSLAGRISGEIPPSPQPPEEATFVVSPWSGIFCAGAYYGEPPYVVEGDEVEAGALLCRIESMRNFEIHAPFDATIVEVRATDGQMVTAGEVLMVIQRKTTEPL